MRLGWFVLLQMSLLWAQTDVQFVRLNQISDQFLSGLVDHAIVMSFDLSPDGKQIAILAVAGSKVRAPLWLVTLDTRTKQVAASKELGSSVWPTSVFLHQVLYSSDQRYLVVQDLREIRVFDTRNLESLRTIPPSMAHQTPVFVVGAGNSDIFVCAFGSEPLPKYGLRATPVQVEVVDVSSGKILGEWASEDVPQSVSANGELIAVSSWQRQRQGVVPLNVFDRSGRKIAELNDGFSFKDADGSRPLGKVLGRFLGNQEILLVPDANIDDRGRHSGETMKLLNVAGEPALQSIAPRHFSPTGQIAVSGNGKTSLVDSFYIPPRLLAQHHGVLPGGEGNLLILGREPKLHVESEVTIDSFAQDPRASADGSVIAIRHYNRDITVMVRSKSGEPPPK